MPGLAQRNESQFSSNVSTTTFSCSNSSVSVSAANGFWSKHRDDVCYNQLQKFWSDLSPQARQVMLRIDKQTLFEQARKNMYCSRCNGLLLEGFLQIVMYGKSLQQDGAGGHLPCIRIGPSKNQNDGDMCMTNGCQDDVQDPSVHPWGGLTTTRDGTLTLLDCYLYSKSLKGLQNVFDSARARERERELLYPDACGGGGRGWISQGIVGYGRVHGTRETCALHTARLSVDTLVDFWSALGEETRQSLLRMKEEDFIERLMYRFDSKRFCRDCRRNVIREFKELKELKRMRREPHCTSWFCVADTAFQYEVSHDAVQANWHQTFVDTFGTYHHFEWAVGTGEGKSDILDFENVGLSGRVQVNGLDLSGLNACYITLRAWRMDGRCTELSVKAHALKGQQCVHCRLVVGDGFVTITRGESIRRFFEHAEEAEEEEDDDSVDKDGNELDGECSRPQKHAKSPELAREFLLDTATVIFKEQVEKAFREGTARQNAHSIFVSLALKLLEERVLVACKEIVTLEKQMKLLEEEEKEKREEEERKERRRIKEREKKFRRKERLREKEKEREKKYSESIKYPLFDVSKEETQNVDETNVIDNGDSISETTEAVPPRPLSPDIQDEQFSNGYVSSYVQKHSDDSPDGELSYTKDGNDSFEIDHSKYSRQTLKYRKESLLDPTLRWSERRRFAVVSESGGMISKSEPRYHGDNFEASPRNVNGFNKHLRSNSAKSNTRNSGPKFGEKFHCSNNRMSDRYNFHACSCNQQNDHNEKVELNCSTARLAREIKSASQLESVSDISKPYYIGNKYNQGEYMRESCGRSRNKIISGKNPSIRESPHTKKVWEPMESQKKYPRSNSDYDVTLRSSTLKVEGGEPDEIFESSVAVSSEETRTSVEISQEDTNPKEAGNLSCRIDSNCQNGFHLEAKFPQSSDHVVNEGVEYPISASLIVATEPSMSGTSTSDNCSSCLSEGDSNASSSNSQNPESSSNSDSEEVNQLSEGRETSLQNGFPDCHEVATSSSKQNTDEEDAFRHTRPDSAVNTSLGNLPTITGQDHDNGKMRASIGPQPQGMLPPLHNQGIHFPMFRAPSTMGYYHQSPVSWPAAPANGVMPFPHPSQYVFTGPFGYGLNGSSHYMQYGALQHVTPPLLNPNPVPVIQTVTPSNGINSKEHAKIFNLGGANDSRHEAKMERVASMGRCPMEAPPNAKGSDKPQMGNTGFSLFHFGGPVALSTGAKPNPVHFKEGSGGDISSNLSEDHIEGDLACNKKDAVEEYNLFAASNGIRFSFF